MNYPVWEVAFGSGLLVAVVSIVHVFVSHFAVGGGLFLVLTEMKAYRENDTALLDWLKIHTKFFVLLTVVFGAISGVGIWFTIGLVNPSATSSLIHTYVWGWAIEWVFFFLEITAALMYLYGWRTMDRRTHVWFGWVYFVTAFLSMVIINGIITYMLTPGRWIENQEFWSGFFNPTYWPSLLLRFGFSLALAGIYALLTGTRQRDPELKAKIVKWSARWVIPAFVLLPFIAWWYVGNIPDELWASTKGFMSTATHYAGMIVVFSIITFLLSLFTLFRPRQIPFVYSLLVLISAFVTMWSFEFVREAVRKPYVIAHFMYANALYVEPMEGDGGFTVENINRKGVLNVAKWVGEREVTPANQVAVGKEIFRVECMSCHTTGGYRAVRTYFEDRQWSPANLDRMLGGLEHMHNGIMPPFAGTAAERGALAAYLATLYQTDAEPAGDGESVYGRYCSPCHVAEPAESPMAVLGQADAETLTELLGDLTMFNEQMPALELSPEERAALAEWVVSHTTTAGTGE
jgi:mono/diheme cytochrome c family protein/cytochrome bd-type quinol oxidase subunit 1